MNLQIQKYFEFLDLEKLQINFEFPDLKRDLKGFKCMTVRFWRLLETF